MNTDKLKELAMAHTPEPWHLCDDGKCGCNQINGKDCEYACTVNNKANARRIVACVNACRGLSTEELQKTGLVGAVGYQLINLESQRDVLLAALKQAESWLEGWASADYELGIIRAAIAKAVQS